MISQISSLIEKIAMMAQGLNPLTGDLFDKNSDINTAEIKKILNDTLSALNASDTSKIAAKIQKNKSSGLPEHHGLPWTEKEVNWLREAFNRINGKIPSKWLEEKLKRKQGAIIKKCVEEQIIPFFHAMEDYLDIDPAVKSMLLAHN